MENPTRANNVSWDLVTNCTMAIIQNMQFNRRKFRLQLCVNFSTYFPSMSSSLARLMNSVILNLLRKNITQIINEVTWTISDVTSAIKIRNAVPRYWMSYPLRKTSSRQLSFLIKKKAKIKTRGIFKRLNTAWNLEVVNLFPSHFIDRIPKKLYTGRIERSVDFNILQITNNGLVWTIRIVNNHEFENPSLKLMKHLAYLMILIILSIFINWIWLVSENFTFQVLLWWKYLISKENSLTYFILKQNNKVGKCWCHYCKEKLFVQCKYVKSSELDFLVENLHWQ